MVPKDFKVYQNYPNPFNPTTKIIFDLPRQVLVKFTIYDVLGRELEKLKDNILNAGIFELVWDASKYPSGVYFYKLEAGDFSMTKKMILIK